MSNNAGGRSRFDGSRVSHYEFHLPDERIARYPTPRRDESRLMVVPPAGAALRHLQFSEIGDLLRPGDLLVVNESRVIPARLHGFRESGAPAEVLLLRPAADWRGDSGGAPSEADRIWHALVRPANKLRPGREIHVAPELSVVVRNVLADGVREVELRTEIPVEEALGRWGRVPLPPYLGREDDASDRERYQTVYARVPGSVAAPTAGLHFTPELLEGLAERGVERAPVTLHIGLGTFRPIDTEDPADFRLHEEWYEIPDDSARRIRETRAAGGRIWAVGTTAVRTLEAAADPEGRVVAGTGTTDLFIRPPYEFRVVQGLVTNFHLPRSTLLMLVAARAGYHRTMEAYEAAVEQGYRFYSYGDAMVIPPREV